MSKKSVIEREKKKENLVKKFLIKRQELKKALKIANTFKDKLNLSKKLQKLPKNSSIVRLKNRCSITGKAKGFFRFFGLSRNIFREFAHNCLLPGVIKSSW